MTSNDTTEIRYIVANGVFCKSDMALYETVKEKYRFTKIVYLLTLYGTPLQVKYLFSLLNNKKTLSVVEKYATEVKHTVSLVKPQGKMRLTTFSLGHNRLCGLISLRDSGIGDNIILWHNPADELDAFSKALSRRVVPYDPLWVTPLYHVLLDEHILAPLEGWGAYGVRANWSDEKVCDLIVQHLLQQQPLPAGDVSVPGSAPAEDAWRDQLARYC